MTRLQRLAREETGMSYIFVGMGFLAFLSASMLAIDVGMLMTARNQAQNSADAGALAGAVALVFDDYLDRSPSGPAVTHAISAAQQNVVMGGAVSVTPGDVEFPTDPTGEPNRVRVTVYRRSDRGNPLSTFIARYFGRPTADIAAIAMAEASPANAATCVKPWAVPDKWIEMQTPAWSEDDTYDEFDNHGNVIANPDVFHPATNKATYTGFDSNPTGPDYGRQILLKAGNPHQAISSSHFFPIALPPDTGASWYEENIPGCWPGTMGIGDLVPVEPGNMTGPTTSGTQELIDKDPTAYWDTGAKRVVSSFNPSPRIIVIPVFDPHEYELSRQHGRQEITVANLVGFFVEELQGNSVLGRIVPHTGLIRGNGPVPGGSFLKAIRLIQ
jgi:hypothetical protein